MITKAQAQALACGTILHFGECKVSIGPRGGKTPYVIRCRVNGKCQTWAKEPDRFRLPIKRGLYEFGEVTEGNADRFHVSADCPHELL